MTEIVGTWHCRTVVDIEAAIAAVTNHVYGWNQAPEMCPGFSELERLATGQTLDPPLRIELVQAMLPINGTPEEWDNLKQAGDRDRDFHVTITPIQIAL